jgi:transposase-like protein
MKKVLSPVTLVGETKGARRATEVSPTPDDSTQPVRMAPPDPEVTEQARRRRFPAEYKLRILRQSAACTEPGEVGALLRREGLYSSLLSTWRRQREQGALEGLRPKKRGRKGTPRDANTLEVERLRKENARLQRRLDQAELIIDVQKKISALLGIPLKSPGSDEND